MKRLSAAAFLLTALLTACPGGSSPTPGPTPNPNPPSSGYSFEVSAAVKPTTASIPSEDGKSQRPVGAVRDAKGVLTQFVENEVLFSSKDPSAVQALLNKYKGKIVNQIEPPKGSGLKTVYAVQLDLSGVDPKSVGQDWSAYHKGGGKLEASSETVLKLVQAIASEHKLGVKLKPNFVSESSSFFNGSSEKDNQDALAWDYFQGGGVLDINVAGAWRALEQAGKLGNKVKVGIVDEGFEWNGNLDFPAIASYDDRLPAKNTREDSKPWHATMVAQALAGQADNGYGAAGPGAPVVQTVLVKHNGSEDSAIKALNFAYNQGARILNMSFGGTVEQVWYTDEPDDLEDTTRWMWESGGALLFAAAGNDGENIDTTDDGDEDYWYWPCENDGVYCVGGLAEGQTFRDPSSNYSEGRGSVVDLWAPFTVKIGPTPNQPGNIIQEVSGTSFSSPFVAGVAALIWAANPKLSSAQVWGLLEKHARKESGLPRVNAFDAVKEALILSGDNVPPRVKITSPASGLKVSQAGLNVGTFFGGSVSDLEPGCCAVKWTSSLDGLMGSSSAGQSVGLQYSFAGKTPGKRTVTMSATDAGGKTVSDSVVVELVNAAPTLKIVSPSSGTQFTRGVGGSFKAVATDDLTFDPADCTWTSSKAGDGPWNGCERLITFGSSGPRTLSVQYKDSQGATSNTVSVAVDVKDPPPSGPPIISMIRKTNSDPTNSNAIIDFSFTDPGGPGEGDLNKYTFKWTATFEGVTKTIAPRNRLGKYGSVLVSLSEDFTLPNPACEGKKRAEVTKSVTVNLSIKDPEGLTGSRTLNYTFVVPGCILIG